MKIEREEVLCVDKSTILRKFDVVCVTTKYAGDIVGLLREINTDHIIIDCSKEYNSMLSVAKYDEIIGIVAVN